MPWQCALSSAISGNELVKKRQWTTGCLCSTTQCKGGGTMFDRREDVVSVSCQQHCDNNYYWCCSCIGNICVFCLAHCLYRLLGNLVSITHFTKPQQLRRINLKKLMLTGSVNISDYSTRPVASTERKHRRLYRGKFNGTIHSCQD